MKAKENASLAEWNRKYKGPEARGSRASTGNWKRASWLSCDRVEWLAVIWIGPVVCWSRLIPVSETWLHMCLPNSTYSDLKLAKVGVFTPSKSAKSLFNPREPVYQLTIGLNYVELCLDSESNHSTWFLIWELKQQKETYLGRGKETVISRGYHNLHSKSKLIRYEECPLAFWLYPFFSFPFCFYKYNDSNIYAKYWVKPSILPEISKNSQNGYLFPHDHLSPWTPAELSALFILLPLSARICPYCLTFMMWSFISRLSHIFFHFPK